MPCSANFVLPLSTFSWGKTYKIITKKFSSFLISTGHTANKSVVHWLGVFDGNNVNLVATNRSVSCEPTAKDISQSSKIFVRCRQSDNTQWFWGVTRRPNAFLTKGPASHHLNKKKRPYWSKDICQWICLTKVRYFIRSLVKSPQTNYTRFFFIYFVILITVSVKLIEIRHNRAF